MSLVWKSMNTAPPLKDGRQQYLGRNRDGYVVFYWGSTGWHSRGERLRGDERPDEWSELPGRGQVT